MGNGETLAYNMLPNQEQIGRGVLLLFGKLPRRRPRIFPGNWFFDNLDMRQSRKRRTGYIDEKVNMSRRGPGRATAISPRFIRPSDGDHPRDRTLYLL